MTDPWKKHICENPSCWFNSLDENGKIREDFIIYPDIDNETLVQFACPACRKVETWGVTRMQVMQTLYERLQRGNL